MRPEALNPYFASVSRLKGIGPKIEQSLSRLLRDQPQAGSGRQLPARVLDVLFHLPVALIDRSRQPTIAELPEAGVVTIKVTVGRHKPPPRHNRRIPYRVDVFDDTGSATLVFFHAHVSYLTQLLPEGEARYVSGFVERYGGRPQLVHPDYIVSADQFGDLPLLEPVYPLAAGVSSKVLQNAVRQCLERAAPLDEWQESEWVKRHNWPGFAEALRAVHTPHGEVSLSASDSNRCRLAYDELLANQLALALMRAHMKRGGGRALIGTGNLSQQLRAHLPYALTTSQEDAIRDIGQDMQATQRMLRLLQGDVGSGKTVVAVLAMAVAVEAGTQAALMVPTELLARQHLQSIEDLVRHTGLTVAALTGRDNTRERAQTLADLKEGKIDILIGTHALFQETVEFHDLGLVVIDEQHRFGVHQRLALQAKGQGRPDLLVTTATPIPRTLALTAYGDMDVSRLVEKPAGRQPVDTRVMPLTRLDEVVSGLSRAVSAGQRAYWICPLVESSDQVDLTSAEERFQSLAKKFGDAAGLVHGRMKPAEKDAVMAAFRDGDISVLVATTVVEVGVDVREATIMVIENAERFGLAQLHQLRGRVGRGNDKSSCVLLYSDNAGATAKARLKVMRDSQDGFFIAEEDLRLRGSGEVLGTRQSGVASFRLADLAEHAELLQAARDDAQLVVQQDRRLQGPRGEALRTLLYLFERDDAVRLLSAG